MAEARSAERWSSRLGVILAVAGSAVGLGNFLRFPGLAAQYGSGAFMIAYFVSLILLGIPICWIEWTLGRYAGRHGYHSSPGIFYWIIRHPAGKYLGVLGVLIPLVIFMYYVYIEAWCLGYAVFFLTRHLDLGPDISRYVQFWQNFVGATQDGLVFSFQHNQAVFFLILVFGLNFYLIYRGLVRGIETFCKYAIPLLILLAVVVLIRVLTLGTPDPARPELNVGNALGFMWNPGDVVGQLKNPQLWLAAAGQIFFSLSVGFGVVITYASYLRENDDIVLSGLSASSANEFCEVALGGLITVPAAYLFLGAAGIVGQGTFALGFNVLPMVFSKMPAGWVFGGLFFLLLFLAAITSSLSMLQPGVAFLEEGFGLTRRQSVALLGMITAIGCVFVVYFSRDLKALDTLDFWVGTVCIYVMATVLVITYGWVMGIDRAWEETHRGAEVRLPTWFKYVIKYVSPAYLLGVFVLFLLFKVFGWDPATGQLQPTSYVMDLVGQHGSTVARLSVCLILIMMIFISILINAAGRRWETSRDRTVAGNQQSKPTS